MNDYVKMIDGLPLIVKIILALPFADWIVFGIYRMAKGHLIAGILWLILGWPLFIIDIVQLALNGKVTFLAE